MSNEILKESVQHSLDQQFPYRVLNYPVVTRRKGEVWIHSISNFVFHAAFCVCVVITSDFFQKDNQHFTEGYVCGNSVIKPFTEPSSACSLPIHVLALAVQQNNNLPKLPEHSEHAYTAPQQDKNCGCYIWLCTE